MPALSRPASASTRTHGHACPNHGVRSCRPQTGAAPPPPRAVPRAPSESELSPGPAGARRTPKIRAAAQSARIHAAISVLRPWHIRTVTLRSGYGWKLPSRPRGRQWPFRPDGRDLAEPAHHAASGFPGPCRGGRAALDRHLALPRQTRRRVPESCSRQLAACGRACCRGPVVAVFRGAATTSRGPDDETEGDRPGRFRSPRRRATGCPGVTGSCWAAPRSSRAPRIQVHLVPVSLPRGGGLHRLLRPLAHPAAPCRRPPPHGSCVGLDRRAGSGHGVLRPDGTHGRDALPLASGTDTPNPGGRA